MQQQMRVGKDEVAGLQESSERMANTKIGYSDSDSNNTVLTTTCAVGLTSNSPAKNACRVLLRLLRRISPHFQTFMSHRSCMALS